ncbi:MAG: hypothetical protein Kow0058_19880 [Roseovarius sp.]
MVGDSESPKSAAVNPLSIQTDLIPLYATDADALIASSQVVATHFATVAAANDYWRRNG